MSWHCTCIHRLFDHRVRKQAILEIWTVLNESKTFYANAKTLAMSEIILELTMDREVRGVLEIR